MSVLADSVHEFQTQKEKENQWTQAVERVKL